MGDTRSRGKRGRIWATLFILMGAIYLTDGIRNPEDEIYRLLMGAGFLLVVPRTFFSPISFARPTFTKV